MKNFNHKFFAHAKKRLKRIASRMPLLRQYIQRYEQLRQFSPYIKELHIDGVRAKFFFATLQAKEWYDSLPRSSVVEYEWVLKNIDLCKKKIVDVGGHHGHYSVVLAVGAKNQCDLMTVEPFQSNCSIIEVNLTLNGYAPNIINCACTSIDGYVRFSNEPDGRILSRGGVKVPSKRLVSIMPEAQIIKIDTEGSEFEIVPDSIDEMKDAYLWIVEIHPAPHRIPDELIKVFLDRSFEIRWVNRDTNKVERYKLGSQWKYNYTTIFASKPGGPFPRL